MPSTHELPAQTNALSIPNLKRLDKFIRHHLFLLAVAIFLNLTLSISIGADPAPPQGLLPFPEGKESTTVRLAALTVDAYFLDAQNTWRFLVHFRLYNPSKTDMATIRIHLRGLLPDGTPISEIYGGEGYTDNPTTPFVHRSFERTLGPEERVWYTFLYTAKEPPLPWSRFVYTLSQLSSWPEPTGSIRVTLHMNTLLAQHAYLSIHPKPTRFNGEIVEWQWENRTPDTDVETLFIRPTSWTEITQQRQQAHQNDEEAIASLAQTLTDWLTQEQAPDTVMRAFYPEALALWTQLADLRPEDPAPWQSMVALYRARAVQTHDEDTYRPFILAALREAWKRGDHSEATRQQLATLIQAQIDYLLHVHHWQEAIDQLDTFADLLGPGHQAQIKQLRQQIASDWAQERLKAQDWDEVRTALKAGWGEKILAYFQPQGPTFHYLNVEIFTSDHTRSITLTAALDTGVEPSGEEMWNTFLSRIPTALPQAQIRHKRQGHLVQVCVDLPFITATDLQEQQRRLVGIMPDIPEWEPMRNALTPRYLRRAEHTTLWGWTMAWEEEVDLSPAHERLTQSLERLRATLTTPPTPDFPETLYPVLRAFRATDIKQWVQFMEHIEVVYTLKWTTPPGPPEARQWRAHVGDHLVMQAERPMIAPIRLAAIGGLLILGWTTISFLLWRVLS